ncbi:uncharacterized protein LOC124842603 [Vigna umbellata]|uniref:uncharacterized protein LOC124842603 n=1 Tax=Vigna umbellata TaxID=87088 RepID=UPI001F5F0672|nr:uncharacterized protein LOC124842603 [Vigna umbellata]
MSGAKASSSGNLIINNCLLYGKDCVVLFDSRATYSFVSKACVERLGLILGELHYDLVVSTPTAGLVRTSLLCARCLVEVEGRRFNVNLICLPLQGLEVILGMDWLSINRILIDCGEKKLVFPKRDETVPLSSGQLKQELLEGACYFLVLSHLEVVPSERFVDRSIVNRVDRSVASGIDRTVVREFLNVFPDEVPGLPPQREVEFSIDLVSGVGPVSIAPYRMAPVELAEL